MKKIGLAITLLTLLLCNPSRMLQAQAASPTPVSLSQIPASVTNAAELIANGAVGRLKRREGVDEAKKVVVTKGDAFAAFAVAAQLAPEQAKAAGFEPAYVASVETRRTDKQIGASSFATGTTSNVSKPSTPQLLGIAIDHGTISQNINGSTLTLSSSPYALIASVKGDTAQTYDEYSGYARLGITASFNVQNTSDPLASATRKQLTEWTARFRLVGDHSGRSKAAQKKYRQLVLPKLQFVADLQSGEHDAIFGSRQASAILKKFGDDLEAKLNDYLNTDKTVSTYQSNVASGKADASSEAKITEDISGILRGLVQQDIYNNFSQIPNDTEAVAKATTFLSRYITASADYSKAAKAFDETLTELEQQSTLSLAYLQERGSGTPDYSVVQLLFEKKPKDMLQIDLNVSGSFYHKPNPSKNEQTFRDFTAALGLQQSLGRSPFLSTYVDRANVTASVSGKYERMQENLHIPGKKADIAVINGKLEIPVAAGVTLPLSVTYANATELTKESEAGGISVLALTWTSYWRWCRPINV